jgi:hydrogenase maturation protein HypF
MLPYSPLHYLLVESLAQPLVMTSANISDEPVCYEDSDACARLSQIADYYLMHNRRIHMRADDSVVRVNPAVSLARNPSLTGAQASSLACLSSKQPGRLRPSQEDPRTPFMILRRSRGYAPAPISTAVKFSRQILACGAELKNTFCIARNHHAFVSHHIGDLENLETLSSFTAGIEHFKDLFALDPEVVAYDLHPEYLSTKHALAMDEIETKIGVQHHHAHIASCMADNQIEGEVIGVAMDGLGFGADGRLWGGEFLVANFAEARRMAHLEYIPMPGGARAIREPWRMAVAYLQSTFGDNFLDLDIPFVRELDQQKAKVLAQMAASRANSPESSSMGRLFDAVASLVRLRDFTNYEGQAAIELEQITDVTCEGRYQFEIADDGTTIAAQPVIRSIVEDILDQVPPATVSAKFHAAVADLILEMAANIESKEKLRRVVLSGGVFQNLILLKTSCAKLQAAGFEVFTHGRVPANDGGISLGPAVVANARL